MDDKVSIYGNSALMTTEFSDKFKELNRLLNKQVSKNNIRTNAMADNSQYIPISVIESHLDEIFLGLWEIKNLHTFQLLNSVVCELELVVTMPNGMKITRCGSGAVPIMLKKGERDITPETINPMGLQKNVPAAKSFALSNAAQSLGNYFGRNINRKDSPEDLVYIDDQVRAYEPLYEKAIDLLGRVKIGGKDAIKKSIDTASSEKLKSIIEFLEGKL